MNQIFEISPKLFLGIIVLAIGMYSCKPIIQDNIPSDQPSTKDLFIHANKYLLEKEVIKINSFLDRSGWKMNMTETALWYDIYEKGTGDSAVTGKYASIHYSVTDIDGTPYYSSDSLGAKKFLIGKGGVESGLEQGILLMRVGDKARFIMPPHLAHGFTGDGIKIGKRAILIYTVELIALSDKQ